MRTKSSIYFYILNTSCAHSRMRASAPAAKILQFAKWPERYFKLIKKWVWAFFYYALADTYIPGYDPWPLVCFCFMASQKDTIGTVIAQMSPIGETWRLRDYTDIEKFSHPDWWRLALRFFYRKSVHKKKNVQKTQTYMYINTEYRFWLNQKGTYIPAADHLIFKTIKLKKQQVACSLLVQKYEVNTGAEYTMHSQPSKVIQWTVSVRPFMHVAQWLASSIRRPLLYVYEGSCDAKLKLV